MLCYYLLVLTVKSVNQNQYSVGEFVCTPCQPQPHQIHPREGTYLDITFLKYDRYWPHILDSMRAVFFKHFFFLQT